MEMEDSVDTRPPTESELCDEFNASRFTVREALRRLVEQGMVQRRQGAGEHRCLDDSAGALRAFAIVSQRSVSVRP